MDAASNEPKKACLICHGLGSGGIESFVVNLAKALKQRNYDVKLVMAIDDNGVQQFREQEVADAGIEMFRTCDLESVRRLITHSVRLFCYLKEGHFDIVHSNMNLLNGLNLAIAWLAGARIRVAHAHGMIGSEQSASRPSDLLAFLYRLTMHALISVFANRKCGCSQAVIENSYGKRSVNHPNTYVVYNGVDLSVFAHHGRTEPHGKKLITVGRMVPVKNPRLILEIMGILKDKGYTLDWVGGGEMEGEIRREISELNLSNCINLLGTRKDVHTLLQQADAFC